MMMMMTMMMMMMMIIYKAGCTRDIAHNKVLQYEKLYSAVVNAGCFNVN